MRGNAMQTDDYSDELPVSRGQWRAAAEGLCKLLGVDVPASRFDATVLLVRLRAAGEHLPITLPPVDEL